MGGLSLSIEGGIYFCTPYMRRDSSKAGLEWRALQELSQRSKHGHLVQMSVNANPMLQSTPLSLRYEPPHVQWKGVRISGAHWRQRATWNDCPQHTTRRPQNPSTLSYPSTSSQILILGMCQERKRKKREWERNRKKRFSFLSRSFKLRRPSLPFLAKIVKNGWRKGRRVKKRQERFGKRPRSRSCSF